MNNKFAKLVLLALLCLGTAYAKNLYIYNDSTVPIVGSEGYWFTTDFSVAPGRVRTISLSYGMNALRIGHNVDSSGWVTDAFCKPSSVDIDRIRDHIDVYVYGRSCDIEIY